MSESIKELNKSDTIKVMPKPLRPSRLKMWLPGLYIALGVTVGYYSREYRTAQAVASVERDNRHEVERYEAQAIRHMTLIKRNQLVADKILKKLKGSK